MDNLWQQVVEKRSNNSSLLRRIDTCTAMISACMNSGSEDKEKVKLIGPIIRLSSEVGVFRRSADAMSEEAISFIKANAVSKRNAASGEDILVLPGYQKKQLRHEHVVPCAFLAKLFVADGLDSARVGEELLKTGLRSIISIAEDTKINGHGLQKRMPKNWKIGDNPFLRYVVGGVSDLIVKPENIDP